MSEKDVKEFEEKMNYLTMGLPQETKQKLKDERENMMNKEIEVKTFSANQSKRFDKLVEVYNANIELYCAPIKLYRYLNLLDKDGYIIKDSKVSEKLTNLYYIDIELFNYMIEDINIMMDLFINNEFIDSETLLFCKELNDCLLSSKDEITNEKILNDHLFNKNLSIINYLANLLSDGKYNYAPNMTKIRVSTVPLFINLNENCSLLNYVKVVNDFNFINNMKFNNKNPYMSAINESISPTDELDNIGVKYDKLKSFDFIIVDKREYESKMTKDFLLKDI